MPAPPGVPPTACRKASARLGRMPELPDELKDRPARKPGQQPSASLTLEAYSRLRAELDDLRTQGRERIAERLRVAREHGDIRENAEYDAAKDAQGLMEAQIRRLQEALRDPEIIEAPVAADTVSPHMLVTLRPLDEPDDDETYLLAEHGEERAPGARTVTTSSPLGKTLIGASKDEELVVDAPGGRFRYLVVGFEPFTG
jgi:transcription elongation factor GreA